MYLQELLDLQKELPYKKYGKYFCEIHMQPYLLFCEYPECQMQLCAQCSVQCHEGHTLVDIENKAFLIKQKLKCMEQDRKEIEKVWNLHTARLMKTTNDIKDANAKEMKKIEEMRRQMNVMANEIKIELLEKHQQNLGLIQRATDKVNHYKNAFDQLNSNIVISNSSSLSNDIVDHYPLLKRQFKEMVEMFLASNSITQEYRIFKFEEPPFMKKLPEYKEGRICSTRATVNLWEPNKFIKSSVSSQGLVAIAEKVGGYINIRCFNKKGDTIWNARLGRINDWKATVQNMNMKFVKTQDHDEVLVTSIGTQTEIRSIDDGKVLQTSASHFENLALLITQGVAVFWCY